MSRRDFFKTLSIAALASVLGFKSKDCLSEKQFSSAAQKDNYYTASPFLGCKNKGFEFSVALPFNYKLIDELVEINNTYKKSTVKTLYGSLPANSNSLEGFVSTSRGINPDINSFEDFAKYVTYAKNKGFKFVYLLNSPKPFSCSDFEKNKQEFDILLTNLRNIGCNNIKVANQQLLEVFKSIKDFEIEGSTSFEYTNIAQIKNLFKIYPNIKNFNLAIDTNRNIPLLKSLRETYKDIKFELMADESCLYGCPARIAHPGGHCFVFPCENVYNKNNLWEAVFLTNVIYPWNLDYYSEIGYKNFKLMGKFWGYRANMKTVEYVRNYFEMVENGIENITINNLLRNLGFHFYQKDNLIVDENLISHFPNINHFILNGNSCHSSCGTTCNYCKDLADELNKITKLNI